MAVQTVDIIELKNSAHEKESDANPKSLDSEDPLDWPLALKVSVLIQVSLLSALGGINTAIINPAYVPLAQEFGISTVTASYQTTVCIAINGIGPFIWVPLSNKYGRRPILLGTTSLGFASAIGAAYSKNFGQLIAARIFNGFFPAAFSLGASVVVDIFFYNQRGRAMGVFTVTSVNGSHIAPLLGGPIGQFLGWRWCFKFTAILDGIMFLVILLALPETLHVNSQTQQIEASVLPEAERPLSIRLRRYIRNLRLYSNHTSMSLQWNQFVIPCLKMARYPSVLFPALYYCTQYGFASILPAVTVAPIFSSVYGWNTLDVGLGYGAALTIGGSLGELAAGMVLDDMVKRETRNRNGVAPPPEVRLKAIWTGEILVPAGLLIYGFTMQWKTHWIGPLIGMGVASFGIQVIATTCYTYSIDCYRSEGSEVAQLYNFIRYEFGMTFAFYAVTLCGRIGYHLTFLIFALLGSIAAFLPLPLLMLKGKEIRQKLGRPKHINNLETDQPDEEELTNSGEREG